MNNFDPKITLIQKLSMNIIQYPIIKPDISSIFRNLSSQSECETSFKKKKHPKMDPFGTPNGITTWDPRPGVSKRFRRSSKLPGRVAHDISTHQIQSQGITWDII